MRFRPELRSTRSCDRRCFQLGFLAICCAAAASKPRGVCVSLPPRDSNDCFLQVLASSHPANANTSDTPNHTGEAHAWIISANDSNIVGSNNASDKRNNHPQEFVEGGFQEQIVNTADDSFAHDGRPNLSTDEGELANLILVKSKKRDASRKADDAKPGHHKPKSNKQAVEKRSKKSALSNIYAAAVGSRKRKSNSSNSSLEEYLKMEGKETDDFKAQEKNDVAKMSQALEREVSIFSTLKYGIYESLFRPLDWLIYSGAFSLFGVAFCLMPPTNPH